MNFDHADIYVALFTAVATYLVLMKLGKLPTTDSLAQFVSLFNQKGGIIATLWITSMIFFIAGMRLIYWAVNAQMDNKLTVDNALIVACFSWVSGSAFGGAFGAMIKTMTGEDITPINKTTVMTTSVSTTPPPEASKSEASTMTTTKP